MNTFFGNDEFDDDESWDEDRLTELLQQVPGNKPTVEEALRQKLSMLTTTQLRGIAKRRIWSLSGTRKDDIISQMVAHFMASLDDPKIFAGLTRDERHLLAASHTLFGAFMPLHLEQFNYAWQKLLGRKGTAVPVLKGLESYGVFIRTEIEGDSYYLLLFDPSLPSIPTAPLVAPEEKSTPHHPLIPSFPAPAIINQLERLGYYAAAGGHIAYTSSDSVYARNMPPKERAPWMDEWPLAPEDVKKLAKLSYYRYMNDPPKISVPLRKHLMDEQTFQALQSTISNRDVLDLLILYLIHTGTLTVNTANLEIKFNQSEWQKFLALSELKKAESLFMLWANFWTDVYEVRIFLRENPDVSMWRWAHPDIAYRRYIMEFLATRQLIVRLLQGLTQNKKDCFAWYSLPRFCEELDDIYPALYNNYFDWDDWGFQRKGQMAYEDMASYKQVRFDWLATQFTGPLYWLGMVDLAIQHGRVQAFRLTPLGAHLLNQDEYPAPDQATGDGTAEWQSDGKTIHITPGANLNSLMGILLRITVPVQGESHTYRLGGPGLEDSFAQGENPDSLIAQFDTLGYPLPKSAQSYLQNLYERFGRVHLYEKVTVIEFTDNTAVAELRAANILTEAHILAELSPRLLVIDEQHAQKLFDQLEQKGYTPRMIAQV